MRERKKTGALKNNKTKNDDNDGGGSSLTKTTTSARPITTRATSPKSGYLMLVSGLKTKSRAKTGNKRERKTARTNNRNFFLYHLVNIYKIKDKKARNVQDHKKRLTKRGGSPVQLRQF